jgi:hypothetical protein
MGNVSSRTLRKPSAAQKELTVGDLVAAFYEEAQRMTANREEAEHLARASLLNAMRHGHVRVRRG